MDPNKGSPSNSNLAVVNETLAELPEEHRYAMEKWIFVVRVRSSIANIPVPTFISELEAAINNVPKDTHLW